MANGCELNSRSPTGDPLCSVSNYEILVASTQFLVALATRKAQFRTLRLMKGWRSKHQLTNFSISVVQLPYLPTCKKEGFSGERELPSVHATAHSTAVWEYLPMLQDGGGEEEGWGGRQQDATRGKQDGMSRGQKTSTFSLVKGNQSGINQEAAYTIPWKPISSQWLP